MATHSSILAWKTPWTEEPGRLQSKESDMTEHTQTGDWGLPDMGLSQQPHLSTSPSSGPLQKSPCSNFLQVNSALPMATWTLFYIVTPAHHNPAAKPQRLLELPLE